MGILLLGVLLAGGCRERGSEEIRVPASVPLESREQPAVEAGIQRALVDLEGPVTVVLEPGHHWLMPTAHVDPSCGNCQDPLVEVPATRGLLVRGTRIRLVGGGASPEEVVVHVRAGYGILFDGCADCALENLTVTGGERDADGRATDGAVVVRDSRVSVRDCVIRDNVGDRQLVGTLIVGIAGIVGREGSSLDLADCRILRNSWDGIALYRGASATIRDCVIDGVDEAVGGHVAGGRGSGIGLTWDSRALVEGVLVTRHWKGIGVLGSAQAQVRHCIVEDVAAWGLAVWGGGSGTPSAFLEGNVVYQAGACGALLDAGKAAPEGRAAGSFRGNVLAVTGRNPEYDHPDRYCRQEAVAVESVPEGFVIEDNVAWGNREAGGASGSADVSFEEFQARCAPLVRELRQRPALAGSRFLADIAPE